MIRFFFLDVTPVFPALRFGERSIESPAVASFFAGVASGEVSPDRTRFEADSTLGNESSKMLVSIGVSFG